MWRGMILTMKYSDEEQIVDAVMALMVFLWMLFGACCIGLLLAITKGILIAMGIENNL